MIFNIIDKRSNKYNVYVHAVFEPAWHDNHNLTQDCKVKVDESQISVSDQNGISIVQAINIANTNWDYPITLFLYDANSFPLGKPREKKRLE
jgi:hypothetical protein